MKKICYAVIIPLSLLLSSFVTAQKSYVSANAKIQGHPRILMFANDEAVIKKMVVADTTWLKIQQGIINECDRLLEIKPVERIKIGRRLLDKSREALRRIFFLSYAYRVTDDVKYFQRAEKEMLVIAMFSDWNPTHFLDVAEMTMAVSIGYDWLYNDLSQNSRTIIKEAIRKKGIEPSLNSKYNSWLKGTNNWNQVCNAGMAYGAMAIYEDYPELSAKIINRALESVALPMGDYAPDGAYPEGYGYWGYGTSFNVMFISALERLFGKDFGLSQKPGFLKTAGYLENMTGPSGDPFNYSDAGSKGSLHPAMFWFAQKLKDPSLLWVERSRLINSSPQSHIRNRLLPAILLWSNGIRINSITPPKTKMWVGKGKTPVALMRTSWTDSGIFVGMKGGSPSAGHAHMDVGSFVMEADGERWAMDFGMQKYESLESKGVQLWGRTQDAQRWEVFRYNNFVHNTLTINGQLQKVKGYAPIIGSSSDPQFMNATVDLTQLYKGVVDKAIRGVGIVDQKYVVVRDEIETLDSIANIRWTLLTSADVKIIDKNQIELTKDNKKLILKVLEPDNIDLKTWTTVPPHRYDAPNPGTILTGFEVRLPPKTKTAITVVLIPEGSGKTVIEEIQPLQKWNSSSTNL